MTTSPTRPAGRWEDTGVSPQLETRMAPGKKPEQPPKDTGWQESRLPGERSGEGVKDLFDLVVRDIRRKAGLTPKPRTDKGKDKDKS